MKHLTKIPTALLLSTLVLLSFVLLPKRKAAPSLAHSDRFLSYWNDNQAELSSYELKQARYGEIHSGEAVLIYVTEPFSKSKQVKLDDWQNQADREDVLKLNFVRKFDTGIYPYSTMLSVFSSLNTGRLVKLTHSVQEWCGQVFMQFNHIGQKLHYYGRSYFEAEGDQAKIFDQVLLEDELWNQIRLSPAVLPIGKHRLIPSTLFLRFNHHATQIVEAKLSLEQTDSISVYQIQYQAPEPRTLQIKFLSQFPYTILGWEEEYEDIAWNSERKVLKTQATLKKSIRLDYWNKNKLEHQRLRQLLN